MEQVDTKRTWLRRFALLAMYFVAAAAVHAGIFAKWTFRDDSTGISLIDVLDGTASRPFVYRQLLPATANALDKVVPDRLKVAINPGKHLSRIFARATDSEKTRYEFRYDVVYTLSFLSLFAALFVLRDICRQLLGPTIGATIAPPAFALFLPLIYTIGGYFYDLPELLFLALAVWVCIRRTAVVLPALTILATFNKESFLFFIPALYPLLRAHYSKRACAVYLSLSIAIAVLINLAMKQFYHDNPGGPVELHFLENLRAYATLRTYFQFELTYGILTPKGLSLLMIALVASLFVLGWRPMPPLLRQHFVVAAAIDIPLSLVVGFAGELRNFSFLFVSFVSLICCAINWTERASPDGWERSGQPLET